MKNHRHNSLGSKLSALLATLLLVGCVPPQSPPQAPTSGPGPGSASPTPGNTSQPVDGMELDGPTNTTQPFDTEPPQDGPAASAVQADISAQVADIEAYRSVLAKHHGQVVMVDFWATWCPPCREQFPHTVALSRKYGGQGLAVLSVSLDEPTDKAKVEKFLTANSADFDNLISQYGIGVASAEQFEIGNGGAIPFYKLYDRQGKLRYQFGAQAEEGVELVDQLDARVEQLLAENS